MAYDPRDDLELPECSEEAPKLYDVLDESHVWVSVWSGYGQQAGVKINGKDPVEVEGVFTLDLGPAAGVKGATIRVDTEVAKTNPASAKGALTIVAYQFHAPDVPINRKRWCRTWDFVEDTKFIAETIYG